MGCPRMTAIIYTYNPYFIIPILDQPMRKKPSQLFNLPFTTSYNLGSRRFITLAKIHTFLGLNFYSRLNSIYVNLLQSITKKNYRYLATSLEGNLATKLMQQIKSAQDHRFKLKICVPPAKMAVLKPKKFQKILAVRENIWSNGITRIGIQCNVIFGEKFDKQNPLKLKQKETEESNVYRIGQFRYLRYYPSLGLIGNIKNWYNEQTYELMIKYGSKMHIEVQSFDEASTKSSEEEQVFSEVVLRTGNERFDWIIVNINGMQDKIK